MELDCDRIVYFHMNGVLNAMNGVQLQTKVVLLLEFRICIFVKWPFTALYGFE